MNWNWIKVQQKQVSWHKWLKILLIHINSSFLYWSSSAISHTHAQAVFLCTLTFTEQASYFPSFSQSQHCSGQRFWSRGVLEMLLLMLVCKIKVTSFVSLIVALQGNFISVSAHEHTGADIVQFVPLLWCPGKKIHESHTQSSQIHGLPKMHSGCWIQA